MVVSITKQRPDTLVIVNFYDARPINTLDNLVDQLEEFRGARIFDVVIVVNSVNSNNDFTKYRKSGIEVCIRENIGLNLGAWQYGWQRYDDYKYYIFMQDDCKIINKKWHSRYKSLCSDERSGFIGESYQIHYDWKIIKSQWDKVYIDFLIMCDSLNVPSSYNPSHIQTVVMGCRQEVLQRTGGFVIGETKSEAVAGEILTSVRAKHLGYKNRQSAISSFKFIAHPQWKGSYDIKSIIKRIVMD